MMRLTFVALSASLLAACETLPYSGPSSSGRPDWDATPVPSDECEIIVSKDLGRIKYCQRGDYAEIFRLD